MMEAAPVVQHEVHNLVGRREVGPSRPGDAGRELRPSTPIGRPRTLCHRANSNSPRRAGGNFDPGRPAERGLVITLSFFCNKIKYVSLPSIVVELKNISVCL